MEQITLTKEELKEIIAKEVREALNGKKPISPNSIFRNVKIEFEDFANINRKYEFIKNLRLGRVYSLGHPISLKKYSDGFETIHRRAYMQEVHDYIRKLTLSAFGAKLNSDLNEVECSQAAEMYNAIKEYYLHLYKKRLSGLSIEDFE
ncbi:hypothetical protein [Staphylococcus delphini]|uniref:hypothetical protein n=1 Tax=Staphylococcus delphini TaxID=53344 RepID=UPI0021D2DE2F|nr:hypothetical protein [Staphylococcus delphini]UXS43578.1 hypothetical protein MUA39_09410 [Staphylococcus delphini]UXS45327.1 hypothetical protein MUA39_05585 [Staphylococcus delphini]UXV44272.1 hypothetical protein MUA63_09385 [Staphylococcus delphini]UXV45947.1 hypothetical protein MUA63_05550 [Staphylococcus delphini]